MGTTSRILEYLLQGFFSPGLCILAGFLVGFYLGRDLNLVSSHPSSLQQPSRRLLQSRFPAFLHSHSELELAKTSQAEVEVT